MKADRSVRLSATRDVFGVMPDGRAVARVTLARPGGVSAAIIAFGAALQALELPDRDGVRADICIGHDGLDDYLERSFFGVTIGRVANRIARGRFEVDGTRYVVSPNDGKHALHGGMQGFDTVLWDVIDAAEGDPASVTLRYVSPAGEMGFPGTLTTTAVFSLDASDRLTIEYRAATDATTIVNITNHALWNLSGNASIRAATDHILMIAADQFTPVDDELIPIGARASVAGTPFDFRRPARIADRLRASADPQLRIGRGYDHNWITNADAAANPRLIASLSDPSSGRNFELFSNQPGLQFNSGTFLNGVSTTKRGVRLQRGDALALEPQGFPNAVNAPAFPTTRLEPGEVYRNIMTYKFSSDARWRGGSIVAG